MTRNGLPAALRHQWNAAECEVTPELSLGLAKLHENFMLMEGGEAKWFHLQAAIQRRSAGFFGYSRVAWKMSRTGRILSADFACLLLGPLLMLVLGMRARYAF